MDKHQHRQICEAKRARERAIQRGDMRQVHACNAIIARARSESAGSPPSAKLS